MKKHLDIVTAVSVVEVNGKSIMLQVNEAVHNPSTDHSLLSEYQIRDYGVTINSIARKHGGIQNMFVGDEAVFMWHKECSAVLQELCSY